MKAVSFQPEIGYANHPAARAWIELGNRLPASVDVLRRSDGRELKKSSIYRLNGAAPGGAAIIAKKSSHTSVAVERTVYVDVLPSVPVRQLVCYGFLAERETGCGWLFLEEAVGEPYSPRLEEHRVLATRWLAEVHRHTASSQHAALLPDQGPPDYLACLQAARARIVCNLANPVLSLGDRESLRSIVDHCDAIESHWGEVEQCCHNVPRCLVHGDFTNKNVRVRGDENDPAVLVMDWETAGWAVPAADLDGVDLAAYGSIVRESWPSLGVQDLEILANAGSVFLNLGFLEAISVGLAAEWASHVAATLVLYDAKLADAGRRAGWIS